MSCVVAQSWLLNLACVPSMAALEDILALAL